jgi:hypothetical protein
MIQPHPNWREPQKNRRAVKPDLERTKAGLFARIILLEHQKKVLQARVDELEIPHLDEYPPLDIDLKTGRFCRITDAEIAI